MGHQAVGGRKHDRFAHAEQEARRNQQRDRESEARGNGDREEREYAPPEQADGNRQARPKTVGKTPARRLK